MAAAPSPPVRPSSTLWAVLLLWVVFYASFTLIRPPLLDDADSVHSEVAREMLLRHDFVTLYANGIRYLEKAPLLYWSLALSFKLFGPSTAAARLPLAFTVLALALALEAFGRRALPDAQGSTRAGLYAALILLSSFGIFIFSRITLPDVMVCLWLTLALFAFWLTEQEAPPLRTRLLCYAFAGCCALNVLTKGLIGVVFPLGIAGLYLALTRGFRGTFTRLRQLYPLTGTLVFFALAAPWHLLIGLANPTQGHPGGLSYTHGHWSVPLPTEGNVHGWFWFYFVNEQLLRYLNLRVPRDYDTVPIALFYGLVLVWLLPWGAYLFAGLRLTLSRPFQARFAALRSHRLLPQQKTQLLLLLWAAVPLLFFSVSTRQEYYVLPALPALMLLIASSLATNRATNRATNGATNGAAEDSVPAAAGPVSRWPGQTTTAGVLALLGILTAAACLGLILHTRAPAPDTDLAGLLQQNPGDYALSFGHFLDLNGQAMGMFRLPLALTAVAFGIGLPLAFLLSRSGRYHPATLTTAAAAFLFLLAAHLGLRTFAPVLSSERLAQAIASQLRPSDLIVLHGEYEAGSTLSFYLRRPGPNGPPLHIWDGRSSNLWYGSFFPDAPPIFETNESMAGRWLGPQRIFLWQDPGDKDRPLPPLPGPIYVIAKDGGKEILSNMEASSPFSVNAPGSDH